MSKPSYHAIRHGKKVSEVGLINDEVQRALDEAYTLHEVAQMFDVSRITVDVWRLNHDFPVWKIGGRNGRFILVSKQQLEAWVQEKKDTLPKVAHYVIRRNRTRPRNSRVRTRVRLPSNA